MKMLMPKVLKVGQDGSSVMLIEDSVKYLQLGDDDPFPGLPRKENVSCSY